MKVEITTLKLKIGDREIDLTLDEARKIHKELNSLFGRDSVVHELKPSYVPIPYYVPPRMPYYWETDRPFWLPAEIICSETHPNTATLSLSL